MMFGLMPAVSTTAVVSVTPLILGLAIIGGGIYVFRSAREGSLKLEWLGGSLTCNVAK